MNQMYEKKPINMARNPTVKLKQTTKKTKEHANRQMSIHVKMVLYRKTITHVEPLYIAMANCDTNMHNPAARSTGSE